MRRIGMFILAVFLLLAGSEGYSLTTVSLTDGKSVFMEMSKKNLNLIKFPLDGIRVYTSSKLLDIKIDGENVFVKFLEEEPLGPQEVFFVTPSGVYSMILVPKEIPAQTVVVRIPTEDLAEALNWEASHSYISGLKELIKAMYESRPPRGFSVKEVDQERSRWKEIKEQLKRVYTGATLQGEVYELTNATSGIVRLEEKEFYEKGVLAVSIDRHELKPGEKTELYIVKKTPSQREFEEVLRKHNPIGGIQGSKK